MSISIVTCPGCGILLLSDTAQCHRCHHVFDEQRVEELNLGVLPSDDAVSNDMHNCDSCGEPLRSGLVRCWKCGHYSRGDIGDLAKKQLEANPRRDDRTGAAPRWAGSLAGSAFSQAKEEAAADDEGAPAEKKPIGVTSFLNRGRSTGGQGVFSISQEDDDFDLSDDIVMAGDAFGDDDFDTLPTLLDNSSDDTVASGLLSGDRIPVPAEVSAQAPVAEQELETIPLRYDEPAPAEASSAAAVANDSSTAGQPEADAAQAVKEAQTSDPISEAVAELGSGSSFNAANVDPTTDPLLAIALQEEEELAKRKIEMATKRRNLAGTIIVFCPVGCRIRVQEKHRGKAGKCPKCGSIFFVPYPKAKAPSEAEIAAANPAATAAEVPADRWIKGVRWHDVVPAKLKLTVGSVEGTFQPVDVTLTAGSIKVLRVKGSTGLFAKKGKKPEEIRAAAYQKFAESGTVDGVDGAKLLDWSLEGLGQPALIQPSPLSVEPQFSGVSIFGEGRIAIKVPKGLVADSGGPADSTSYLSFVLSEFREFAKRLSEKGGDGQLGRDSEIPFEDQANFHKCNYSEASVTELMSIDYYKKDPSFKLQVVGHRCAGCGLVVSEESRRREKLGGLNGKGLAKAKCPKCAKPFGQDSLYDLVAAGEGELPGSGQAAAVSETVAG